MSDQDCLTVLSKQHQIGFPMASLSAFIDISRAALNGYTALDVFGWAAASTSPPTALTFAPRQVMAPAVVIGASDLGVDEAVNGFMANDIAFFFLFQSSRYLGGRPALSAVIEHLALQFTVAHQPRPAPVATLSLLMSIGRLITHLRTAVALKLA